MGERGWILGEGWDKSQRKGTRGNTTAILVRGDVLSLKRIFYNRCRQQQTVLMWLHWNFFFKLHALFHALRTCMYTQHLVPVSIVKRFSFCFCLLRFINWCAHLHTHIHVHKCACAHTPRGDCVTECAGAQMCLFCICKYVYQLTRLCLCKHILMTYAATTRYFVPFVVLEAEHEAPTMKNKYRKRGSPKLIKRLSELIDFGLQHQR